MQIKLCNDDFTQLSLVPEDANEEMLLVNMVRTMVLGGEITASPHNRNQFRMSFPGNIKLHGDGAKSLKDYIS